MAFVFLYSPQVIGIDPDLERLKIAREKYLADNIEFLEGTAEEPPLQQFDAVFSNYVLHWCKDKERIFEQVAKRCQRGGKFAFTTAADYDAADRFTPANMFTPEGREALINYVHVPSSIKIEKLLSENNFVIVKLEKLKVQWVFDNVEKLIEFYMTHYKDQKRENFKVEAMKHHYGDGRIPITIPHISVVATKQ
jgi:ubiquinone/menaquinone biosynthesis C-methylase UbiE